MEQLSFWNARYASAGEDYLFGQNANAYLKSYRDFIIANGNSAFFLADGEGRNSVWLAQQGMNVSACDISAVAIEKAKKLASQFNVTPNFICMDFLNTDFEKNLSNIQFDWVIGIFIQFTDALSRVHQFNRMKELTKPGGFILLQGYSPKQLEFKTGGPSSLENLYTDEILKVAFSDWKIHHLNFYEDELNEGVGHLGRSALAGLLAQKPL